MDAHFDSKLQNAQLEGIKLQKPDAVIAIPTDDKETSGRFMELSEVTKLVFRKIWVNSIMFPVCRLMNGKTEPMREG